MEARYAEERLRLEADLRRAEAAAEQIRYGLLYGSGAELVAAVANVFASAGLTTVDLDEAIGDTKSADLLVSAGEQRRLIEVKAVSGAAQESLVGHLQRHLDTWPQLCPHEPVSGGVLVVNHQHKLHPTERSTPSMPGPSSSTPSLCRSCPLSNSSLVAYLQLAGDPFQRARPAVARERSWRRHTHVPDAHHVRRSDAGTPAMVAANPRPVEPASMLATIVAKGWGTNPSEGRPPVADAGSYPGSVHPISARDTS